MLFDVWGPKNLNKYQCSTNIMGQFKTSAVMTFPLTVGLLSNKIIYMSIRDLNNKRIGE